MREYALYKGDELLAMGSVEEIARQQGTKEKTIKFYGTKSHISRTSEENGRRLIELEVD